MTQGIGGTTFRVMTDGLELLLKVADRNEMNHPEPEPAFCGYLAEKGIPVSSVLPKQQGCLLTDAGKGLPAHRQCFIEGNVCAQNRAPKWLLSGLPVMPGRTHTAMRDYPGFPVGIGSVFFRYIPPERMLLSYRDSPAKAEEAGDRSIAEEMESRI